MSTTGNRVRKQNNFFPSFLFPRLFFRKRKGCPRLFCPSKKGFAPANFPRLFCPSKKGFAFSLDLTVSVVAMFFMAALMVECFDAEKEAGIRGIEKIGLEGKAVFVLDAMVKNRDEEQPLLGSALYDWERHRVLSNEIDVELLEEVQQLGQRGFFVKSVSLEGAEEKNVVFGGLGRQCVSLDRVVLVNGSVELLGVVICEK